MIIVKINGGLGNQMFQYALGRCLELKHNIEVKYDITTFETYFRKYELDIFNINPIYASLEEISKLRDYNPKQSKFLRKLPRFIRRNFETYRQEDSKTVIPRILKLKNNAYLDGYWQSERYFKDIENIIKKEFTFKEPLSETTQELASQVSSLNSVSIHVRRTDYITNTPVLQICSLEYYQNAIKYLAERVENPHFYIFSDEPEWVEANLKISCAYTIVTNKLGSKNYEDMHLMSLCKHNIRTLGSQF